MPITIKRFVAGPVETNCFVVFNGKPACCVVDPSSGCDEILAYIRGESLNVSAILLTHAHFDHCMGIEEIKEQFPDATVWVHPDEIRLLTTPHYNGSPMVGVHYSYTGPVRELHEGELVFDDITLTVLPVPGHSPGGCAFVLEDYCLPGDALFAGSIGRTDFTGGNFEQLITNIKTRLFALPDETIVFPGHGNRTTIGREKHRNPFLQ
ncbi:MAG: MBL fold metallo-hydrolase [Chitinivibrionales bacterium]|nr:MBL fold metallo-hydrolase [Chitinivibrionales bacterium]